MTTTTPNPNFYTVGGPVQAGSGVYVPRRADGELLSLCREGTFAYVLTARQMGKSSLMVRTAQQLARDSIVAAIVDLQESGKVVSVEQWYLNFLVSLEDALEDQDVWLETNVRRWWHDNKDLGPSKRFSLFMEKVLLEEVEASIVVFVDEIDTTLGLDFTDDFFVAIRYFYTSRAVKPVFERLSFVLIGVATPGDLIRDPQRTPFNVGRRVEVADFGLAEAMPLVAGLGLLALEAERVMKRVMDWTGGHPYLTQQLCRAVAEKMSEDGPMAGAHWAEAGIASVVAATFFGAMAERDNNLQFVRGMLVERSPDIHETLTTYVQVWRGKQAVRDEEQSLIKSHLKLSGVVQREDDKSLRVRNRIYETVFDAAWVKENLPVNWRRRIKRLQGAIAASFLLMSVMSGFTAWAMWERLRAETQSENALVAQAKADEQRVIAVAEAMRATEALDEVEKQKKIAEAERNRADTQREQAEVARKVAEEQRNQAELTQRQAETAQLIEAEQRQIAEDRQRDAEQAQQAEAEAKEAEVAARQNAEQRGLEAQAATQSAQIQQQISLARLLTAQSEATRRFRGSLLPISILLAAEASQRLIQIGEKTLISRGDADNALRHYTLMSPEIARLNHGKPVNAVSFNPDRRYVATASNDNTARVWDSQSGAEVARLDHNDSVGAVSFSPDGRYVATASNDNTARVWDSQSGAEITRLSHNRSVTAVSFSPDGRYIATTSDGDTAARVWDSQSEAEVARLNHDKSVTAVSFSPDGRYIATASWDDTARVWDSQSGTEIARLNHDGTELVGVRAVNFSSDSRYIATASTDGTARVWNSQSNTEVVGFNHDTTVQSVEFSPDGRYVATASQDNTARVWDSQSGVEIIRLNHDGDVKAVSFSLDGRYIATASRDNTARVWNSQSGSEIIRLNHDDNVEAVSFSLDGRYIATASQDDTARVWDRQSGAEIIRLNHNGRVTAVSFSPGGRYVATASWDDTARVWDRQSGAEIIRLDHDGDVKAVSFSPNGRYVATASWDDTARVWDSQSGTEIILDHDDDSIKSESLFSDLRSNVEAVSFSPDSRYVATASWDGTARVWDSQSGAEIIRFNHDGWVRAVSFSPDGRYIATASTDSTVRVWDSQNGTEIARLNHDGEEAVSFSPNGRYIATTVANGTAEIRYVFTQDVLTRACDRLTRNLTLREWRRYLGEDEPYRKTCPNLPYPDDYEAETENNNPLSSISRWLAARVSTALP